LIFLQILHTIRDFSLDMLPLFAIAFVIAVLSMEYFPTRALDKLLQQTGKGSTLTSAVFGVFLPATPAYRVPMAVIASQGGARWTPVLTFMAGAAAGLSTLIITAMIGWKVAFLRVVISLLFAYLLSVAVSKFIEDRFAAAAMDTLIEPLFVREFNEGTISDIEKPGGSVKLSDALQGALRLARVVLPWIFLSLFIAALIHIIIPAEAVNRVLGGQLSPLKASLMGIPFYFVFGADVPIIIALLGKGMDFGAAVSLMLAAPVVNIPTLMALGRWLGYRKALAFIAICWLIASTIGMLFNLVA